MKNITINIPVYNEEEIILQNTKRLIDYMDSLGVGYEILIVDNGSMDKTPTLGSNLENRYKQVRFLRVDKKGVGIAFRRAIKEARYEHIISMDMDFSVNLSFIEEANILLDEYTIVIGSKILGDQKRNLIRRIGSATYIYIAKLLLKLPYYDYSIGAKAFSRDFVLKHIDKIDDHTHYVLKLCYLARKEALRLIEIPLSCVDYRRSRFNLVKEGLYRFFMLLRLVLSDKLNNL